MSTHRRRSASTTSRLGYGRHPAVHHLDGAIPAGSLTAIVGPNGAGKSTLLKGIVGALRPLDGQIRIGAAVAQRRSPTCRRRPRSTGPFRSPSTISSPWACGRGPALLGGIGRRDRARIEEALAAVGLTGFERRPIGTLSGGQMQRALFARLLLQDAAVILLDEPFTAIDAKTTADLLDLVRPLA